MIRNSVNWQVTLTVTAVSLFGLGAMFFGLVLYYDYVYEWLFPGGGQYSDEWYPSDFVVPGVIALIGQLTATFVGLRLARTVVLPLDAVGEAARSIAEGNLDARARVTRKIFGEAERLVADFNAMAARLESAEAELRYSNTAIAHELRTPLTILRGRLQGLADGVFAPSPQLYDTLLAHIDGLTRLVEDLRTLGLFNADRLELTLDSVDLASEAKAVLQSMEPDMTEAGIALEHALHPVPLRADAARIRQAMLAVLDNARR
jgi:two-component system sensor histidine kinase AdeS